MLSNIQALFIDTGAFIALRLADDRHHQDAHTLLQEVKQRKIKLHTSNFILDEVYGFFCRRHAIAIEMLKTITTSPTILLHAISAEDERKAQRILLETPDKTYSYTDATSFALMERLCLKQCFTFDKHFAQFGITKLPN